MLKFISIKNFKAFESQQFHLSNLNVIAGVNGVGKSSFIQSLLLLRQSFDKNVLQDGLLLNGDYAKIGVGSDALAYGVNGSNISFIVRWDELPNKNVFSFEYESSSDFLISSDKYDTYDTNILSTLSLFNNHLRYLSADREGPKDSYDCSNYHVQRLNSVGIRGEYVPHFLHHNEGMLLSSEKLKHPVAIDMTLSSNINAWISEISPNLKVQPATDISTNKAVLNYYVDLNQGNESTKNIKPKNVGFGISVALPVITVLLSSKPNDLIIIENPEAHLHPYAQSTIGRLCAAAASNGAQVILETHSDHIFNGIRVAIKQGVIKNDLTSVFYLERDREGNKRFSSLTKAEIDSEGRLSHWPKGFMDQWDNDLDALL